MMAASGAEFTLVVTGGGTGGHIFPGIAVAQAMMVRRPGCRVVFIGTERAVDQNAMRHYRLESRAVPCGALKGRGWRARLTTLARLPLSLIAARRVLAEIRPQVVLGVGGYVTGPVVLAAKTLKIATCIHEQNSVPGLTNRRLGGMVDRVFLSIPGSEAYFPKGRCLLSGNPLRREILDLARQPAEEGREILILGGSQGAHRLNTLVPTAIAGLGSVAAGWRVIHQTGATEEAVVREAYQNAGIRAEVAAFFTDMAAVYRRAGLIVSRAGATTLAELTALGKPAILVPFPFAADDHQRHNALALVKAGAALMLDEAGLGAESLTQALAGILGDEGLRRDMGRAAKTLARPEAAETIVGECLALAKRRASHVQEK